MDDPAPVTYKNPPDNQNKDIYYEHEFGTKK